MVLKKAILTMVIFYFLLITSPVANHFLFTHVLDGFGVEFIFPVYWGIILLSGLIVGCTCLILEEIKALRQDLSDLKKSTPDAKAINKRRKKLKRI